MNKTFKVVFNKARGVMTVVNEATSSVQAKGCKAVVAATCVLAASCATAAEGSSAADVTPIQSSGAFINGTEFNIIDSAKESIQIEASEHEGYLKITAKDFVGKQDPATPYLPPTGAVTSLGKKGEPGRVLIWGGEFIENKSKGSAGALAIWNNFNKSEDLDHEIIDVKFINNAAATNGGAIAFHPEQTLDVTHGQTTVSGSTFQGNEAINNGGAFLNSPQGIRRFKKFPRMH